MFQSITLSRVSTCEGNNITSGSFADNTLTLNKQDGSSIGVDIPFDIPSIITMSRLSYDGYDISISPSQISNNNTESETEKTGLDVFNSVQYVAIDAKTTCVKIHGNISAVQISNWDPTISYQTKVANLKQYMLLYKFTKGSFEFDNVELSKDGFRYFESGTYRCYPVSMGLSPISYCHLVYDETDVYSTDLEVAFNGTDTATFNGTIDLTDYAATARYDESNYSMSSMIVDPGMMKKL